MKLFILILFFPSGLSAQLEGKVIGIVDGDTFTLITKDTIKIKIRLAGIDCPERGQPFANVAKIYLSNLIFSKNVFLKTVGFDRYGRTLAIVFIDAINVNESMLRDGMAWHYIEYDDNIIWANLERMARINKWGLWVEGNAMPPWEWRKNN